MSEAPEPRRGKFKIAALIVVAVAALLAWPYLSPHLHRKSDEVEFSRDIRPIFNQNCVSCHGGVRQKNDVSFIFREEALGRGKSGKTTIVPGNPAASELMARVTSTDPDGRMPYHGSQLPPQQIELLRKWIKQGAKWEDYWAFVPPQAEPLPEVKHADADWVRRPLDRFVLARLEKENLKPSAEADKSALLRRVSFDLIGLPPTAEEEAAYLADHSPDAYEKQVDRLLASPRYGERWASMWLDLARYADTKGYEADRARPGVWPYRDWVVDAFNRNLPFDQFVVKQLAGDLLPNSTFEDKIATSFHRQTPNNGEGGTDDEEYRMIAVMDRVATTWSVLNGVTMNCVQCHSHPYDPIRHTDYYKTMAFFNTQNDADLDNDFPNLTVPKDKSRYPEAAQIQDEIGTLIRTVETSDRQIEEKAQWKALPVQTAVANEVRAIEPLIPELERRLAKLQQDKKMSAKEKADELRDLHDTLRGTQGRLAHGKASGPARTFHMRDGEVFTDAKVPPQSFYELTANVDLPLLTAIRIEVPPLDAEKARHTPEDGFIVDKVEASLSRPGGKQEKIAFRYFIQDSEPNLAAAVSVGAKPSADDAEKTAAVDPVPSAFAALTKLFQTRWIIGVPAQPLQMPSGSRIQVDIKQVQEIDSKPALIQRIKLSGSGDPSWTTLAQDPTRAQSIARLEQLEKQLVAIPSVQLPVMVEERPYEQRATLEFERGNFLTKIGPALAPDVPGIFPRLPEGAPRNRLTLAKWFFQPGQPLTARVAVNRYWQELFGTGIVETLENFGSVGEEPSHPELLDWLALHFQNDLHWDMKALLREIVTSATYRQSSASTPTLTARDPRNRLLAHGPDQRLTAEMLRDQALVASGLLSTIMGGPPVMPPQPAGVWNTVYNDSKWTDATGPNRYRRAIYTYIKRTSGYPSFLMFDASDRDTSLPRRIPTNTPLQALVTLNDPVFQEAAHALAERVVKEAVAKTSDTGSTEDVVDARIVEETRLVLSRDPSPRELSILRSFYTQALANPKAPVLMNASMKMPSNSPGAMKKEAAPDKELDALTAVGSILFNLDAALTR